MIIKIKDLAQHCGLHYDVLKTWLFNYQLTPWVVKTSEITLSYNLCDESIAAIRNFLQQRDETSPIRRTKTSRLEKFNKGLKRINNERIKK